MNWQHHPQVAWESDEHSLVDFVVNANRGDLIVLEDNAAVIWESLPGRSTEEITATVAAEFGLESEQIAADVAAFLADLERIGLAVRA